MNGKTAKFLRRWSTVIGDDNSNSAKTLWKDTPRNQRSQLRKDILKQLKDIKNSKESQSVTMPDGTTASSTKKL